jgi:hypothetical protein
MIKCALRKHFFVASWLRVKYFNLPHLSQSFR